MSPREPLIGWRSLTGATIHRGEWALTPISQAVEVHLPGIRWVWHRPTAVIVERGGQAQRLPVVDVTRWLVWSLAGLSAICLLIAGPFGRSRRRRA